MILPATISSVKVPVLSRENVVASEASNSRLVLLIEVFSAVLDATVHSSNHSQALCLRQNVNVKTLRLTCNSAVD